MVTNTPPDPIPDPNTYNLKILLYMKWKRVFVNVINLRILRWGDYFRLFGWALNAITSVPIKETEGV